MSNIPAVIYARYSSSGQREESIEGQIRECRAYADRNGLTVVGEYIDKALTGRTDKRPDFQRMLRDSERGIFQAVICWKIDRFARNRYDSAMYKYRLKKNGVRILYAKETIPDGPEGIILESVMEGFAEYYSENLSQNIRRGNYDSALELKTLGHPVLGLRTDANGRYEPDPDTAPVVRRIFEEYAAGEPAKDIYTRLNAEGYRTVRGGLFNKSSLTRILKNEKYIGVYVWKDIRVEDAITPIVTRELFEAVQRMVGRRRLAPAAKRERFMLTGKLFCGHCGARMTGDSGTSRNGTVHNYYICEKRRRHQCGKSRERKDPLETLVVSTLARLLVSDSFVDELSDSVMEYQSREKENGVLRALEARLAENDAAIKNLMRAIEMGILTPSTKSRLLELEAEQAEIHHGILVQQMEEPGVSRADVVSFLRRFRQGRTEGQQWRAFVVDTFLNSAFLYDDGTLVLVINYAGEQNTATLQDVEAGVFAAPCSVSSSSGVPDDANLNTPKLLQLYLFDKVVAVVVKSRE